MSFKFCIFTIGFIFISLGCFSNRYIQINIGTKGELRDNYVHCIYKDTDGFIWIGTGTTLERWDGIRSVAYPFPENNLEYAPHLVNDILERKPHEYWAGGKKGLWKLNLKSRKMEQAFPEQINFQVYSLAKDKEDKLYLGTENGLYIYEKGDIRNVRVNSKSTPPNSNHVLGVEVVSDEKVWLMTPEGLALCEPRSGTIKFYSNTLPECGELISVTKVYQKLYIGTEKGGIITFDLSNNLYSSFWNKIQAPVSGLSYEDGYLGVATLGQGIQLLSLKTRSLVYADMYNPNANHGLTSNRFSSVLLSDGNIWYGTDFYTGMVNLKKERTLFDLYAGNGFDSHGVPVRAVNLSDDHIFISNRDGFVSVRRDRNEIRYFNTKSVGKDKLRSDLVFSFYNYEGLLLIGTYAGGVSAMIPQTYAFVETPLTKALTKNDVFMFLEDQKGNLWIAASDGLYLYDRETKTIKEYNSFNAGMPGNIVYGIFIDSSDRFWVATNRGVALFDPKTGRCSQELLPEENCIKREPVRSIYEGRDGTLFFCLLNKKKTLFVSDKNLKNVRYPLSVECYNIIQDRNGSYWLATDLGIVKMNESLKRYTLFFSVDGLPDAPMSSGATTVKDEKDRLWMSNMKGLVIVNPTETIRSFPLKITELSVNGEQFYDSYSLPSGESLSLKEKENNLVFYFVSSGYENPEEMKYEYMLEGLDSTWVRLDHENKVAYYNLPPKAYTFKVRKLLDEDSTTEIPFVIKRDFPVKTLLLLLLVAGTVLFVISFVKRKKRQTFAITPQENAMDVEEKKEDLAIASESYVKLSQEEVEKMIHELKMYMEDEKPYLKVDLKQSDVAAVLGYSTYLLSALFTHYLKTGYYDFVNTYRIEEFKNRVKAGEHRKYTLLTLSEQCGFKSKTSFFRSFKKATGLTPKEYVQQSR